ncbi:MAG TPA: hypothetical protein VMT62_16180 [Syntrophorhabdaceae bacterium]|nr:hypothetical protein [Syntrophorhabdaceae bacterium]
MIYKAPTIEEIREDRKKRWVIAMLIVFGDESHDEKEQRVFAVAGLVGTQEEWDALAVSWNQRTGGIPFHAADCESGHRNYKGWPKEDRDSLYADLVNMLVNTKIM